MGDFSNLIGVMDSFRNNNRSLEKYQEKLYHYREQEAKTLIDLGKVYLKNEEHQAALDKFREALQIYRKMRYSEGEGLAHNLIGDTYINERNTTKALQHYQESFKIYSSLKSSYKKELFEKIKDTEKAQEVLDLLKNE